MNKSGVCFGLTVDWLKYTTANPDRDYITDKYNAKYKTAIDFNWDAGKFSITHNVNSKNYYNRINYFQKKANLEFSKTDTKDLYETDSIHIADKAFVILSGKSEIGHACAYKIEQKDTNYHYTYFDPNFGETHSILFTDRNAAVHSLQTLLRFETSHYKSITNGQIDFCNNPEFISDSDKFTDYLVQSWKCSKNNIELYGTYQNSMSYNDFPKEIFENDYYMVA